MKDVVLFVHGTYRKDHLPFYKKLCRSKTKVAVDGGYSFFRKSGIIPDFVIGDMDSAVTLPELSTRTTVITFPARKNKTDSQLAVEYCIDQGAMSIDIVQPTIGQPDHFVANIFLPTLKKVSGWVKKGGRLRIVSRKDEVHFLHDGKVGFAGRVGDVVSVIPISAQIVLECSGTDYDVQKARILRGHTRGLRNRIVSKQAVFAVKGEALIWRLEG